MFSLLLFSQERDCSSIPVWWYIGTVRVPGEGKVWGTVWNISGLTPVSAAQVCFLAQCFGCFTSLHLILFQILLYDRQQLFLCNIKRWVNVRLWKNNFVFNFSVRMSKQTQTRPSCSETRTKTCSITSVFIFISTVGTWEKIKYQNGILKCVSYWRCKYILTLIFSLYLTVRLGSQSQLFFFSFC